MGTIKQQTIDISHIPVVTEINLAFLRRYFNKNPSNSKYFILKQEHFKAYCEANRTVALNLEGEQLRQPDHSDIVSACESQHL